ncbi:MAG TPA: 6-pyruvoyl-tetrahydropterin synthase-related protein [Pyrinomonadaceae bacterium]|nr:6-pyruvoyl-tetrahydropterin synthase-related protein [Pyrinomonadaceae bacterium]
MKKRKLLAPLIICASGLLLTAPLLLYGAPTVGDMLFHAMWQTNFSSQLLAGDLYPRWLLDMNGGLGSPVFFFYAPLPYYITALFAPLLPGGAYGLSHLGASLSLALVASGLTAYLWLGETTGRASAASAAVIYMLAPYHLGVDVYTRGAFAEVWAFVWMPLVLYFVRRLFTAGDGFPFALPGLALSYAALIATHLPTTLIFSLIPPCYALIGACAPPQRKRILLFTVGGMSLGIGLACVYLLPALATQEYVSLGDLLPELYHQRWLRLSNLDHAELDGRITLAVLTTTAMIACAAVLACRDGKDDAASDDGQRPGKREHTFWIVVSLGCLLLMTPAGGFVWRFVKPLQSIQFPWRLNAVLCVAAAALVAPAARALQRRGLRGALNMATVAVALGLVLYWIFFTHSIVGRAHPQWRGERATFDADFVKRQTQMRDAPEYRPANAASTQAVAFDELMSRICRADGQPAKVCVTEGGGEIAVERWTPGEIELRVATESGVAFNVSQFYYPGWAAYLDGRRHHLEPSRPDGLLHLAVPTGAHRVILRLRHTAAEDAGILVSAASVILLMSWLVAHVLHGRRMRRAAPVG